MSFTALPVLASHSRTNPSGPAENTILASARKPTPATPFLWASNLQRSLPVPASHRMTRPSLSPLSSDLPSGENARAATSRPCPLSRCVSLPVAGFSNCTVPSLQPVASTLPSGEKTTQRENTGKERKRWSTRPVPVSHSVTAWSPAVARVFPPGPKTSMVGGLLRTSRHRALPVLVSQMRTMLSPAPAAANFPSELTATALTQREPAYHRAGLSSSGKRRISRPVLASQAQGAWSPAPETSVLPSPEMARLTMV